MPPEFSQITRETAIAAVWFLMGLCVGLAVKFELKQILYRWVLRHDKNKEKTI